MMKRIAEETIVKEKHCHLNQHIAISELKIVTEGFMTVVVSTAQSYLHLHSHKMRCHGQLVRGIM